MTNSFVNKAIIHQTLWVNTTQQNSISEIKHDHLLNVAKALMIQSIYLKFIGSYFVIYIVYIINMFPTHVLNYSSPHEILYKTTLDFNQLKVFRSYVMLALCQQIEKNLIYAHRNVFLLVLKGRQRDIFH